MIKRALFILSFLMISFAYSKLIDDNIQNIQQITNFQQYEQILKKEAQKQFQKQLAQQIKNLNVLLDKKDFEKIYNQTKKQIENKVKKKLSEMMNIQLNGDFESLNLSSLDIKNYVNKITVSNIKSQIQNQLENTILGELNFGIGGVLGMCCCASFINNQIKSLINYAIPLINTEIKLFKEINKKINDMNKINNNVRFNNSNKWNKGAYGKIVDAKLVKLYYLKEIINKNKINTQLSFLINKAINNLKENQILNQKIQMLNKENKWHK